MPEAVSNLSCLTGSFANDLVRYGNNFYEIDPQPELTEASRRRERGMSESKSPV